MFLDCLLGVKQLYIYDSLDFYIQVCHLIFNALFNFLNRTKKIDQQLILHLHIYFLMISKAKMSHVKINLYFQADADTPLYYMNTIRLAINRELILSNFTFHSH